MGARGQLCALALLAGDLAGCGTTVPKISEAWDGVKDIPEATDQYGHVRRIPVSATAQIEFEIKKQIYCELKAAVQTVEYYNKNTGNTVPMLPDDWGASVSLSLQVDESTSLNPGVALNVAMANATSTFGVVEKVGSTTIMPPTTSTPQSFSLGFGGNFSATATRIDKFDPYYTIKYLLKPSKLLDPTSPPSTANPAPLCQYDEATSDPLTADGHSPAKSSFLIAQGSTPILANHALNPNSTTWPNVPHVVSQLGLVDWLVGAVFTNREIPSVSGPPKLKPNDLSSEREALKKRGYSSSQITDLIASGAFLEDVTGLESLGYTRSEIVSYLSKGASAPTLQQYKKEGYQPEEIKKMVANASKGSASKASGGGGGGSSPVDTLSLEIKFIIVSNGNVTPTWKLLRVSANTGSAPLFGLGRTRTHDLIITIGPDNLATANTHLASQIGNSVSNANAAAASAAQ